MNKKVFVACPANMATGGPELMHQLVYHLRNDLNINAFVFYYAYESGINPTPVHPEYSVYNCPYVLEIESHDDKRINTLVVPEVPLGIGLFEKYQKIKKSVWFLSVDNYYTYRVKRTDFIFSRAINKLSKMVTGKPIVDIYNLEVLYRKYDYRNDKLLNFADLYMFQSVSGVDHFKGLSPAYYLSDYINMDYINLGGVHQEKENIVAYNPKKGSAFTKKIISSAEGVEFIPLINMSRSQVIGTLQKAKCYIDFGSHPGKDRIPREAAILGCCVITGKRGSARYYEDVPIHEKYKFDESSENIPHIISKIFDILDNFQEASLEFDGYREIIKQEPKKFIEDLKRVPF